MSTNASFSLLLSFCVIGSLLNRISAQPVVWKGWWLCHYKWYDIYKPKIQWIDGSVNRDNQEYSYKRGSFYFPRRRPIYSIAIRRAISHVRPQCGHSIKWLFKVRSVVQLYLRTWLCVRMDVYCYKYTCRRDHNDGNPTRIFIWELVMNHPYLITRTFTNCVKIRCSVRINT